MNIRTLLITAACAVALSACGDAGDDNRVVGELSSDRIELTAEVNEPIIEILVAEGANVVRGQLLIRQDNARASARLAEADAVLAQTQARMDELVRGPRSEQIAAARANLDGAIRERSFRQTEFERAQQVHAKKLASPDALDRARAALDAASANLELRRAQLQELLSGTTVEELAQAEQSVRQAAARRDYLAIDLQRHESKAPVDGIADSRLFEVGERPAPGQTIMVLLAGEQPHARVYIPEHLRVNVTAGIQANIFVDGLEHPMAGRVRWVANDAAFTPYFALTERDRGRLSYLAKVDLTEERPRLPDGIPVEVELLLGSSAK